MTTIPNRRTTKTSPQQPLPPIQSPDEMYQSTMEYRYGKAVMIEGFLGAPNLVRRLATHEDIGMTRTEMNMWEHIISKQRNNQPPWLAVPTIAELMACSIRSVQRYLRRLEKKELVVIQYNVLNIHGKKTNTYDFTPLYSKVVALYDKLETELQAVKDAYYMQNAQRGDRSSAESGVTPPVEQPRMGDTSNVRDMTARQNTASQHDVNVAQISAVQPDRNSHITADSPHNCRENATEQPDNEESYKKDLLNRYDSRFRTDKELLDYKTSSVPNGYTNRNPNAQDEGYEGNDSHNDQDAIPNNADENRENRNRTPESAGGAGNTRIDGIIDEQQWEDAARRVRERTEHERVLTAYITDFTTDLRDNDVAPANVKRAINIYREYEHVFGGDEQMLIESLYAARAIAKKGKVTKRNKQGGINRMPYFFTTWEQNIKDLAQTIALTIRDEG